MNYPNEPQRRGFALLAMIVLTALLALLSGGCGIDDPVQTEGGDDPPCSGALERCGGVCVDTTVDAANCGACGAACGAFEACVNAACERVCPDGLSRCGSKCVDLKLSPADCGACGAACAAGEVCSNGACALTCQASLTECGGLCVNTATDLASCGACGAACAAGEVCSNGACALSCQASLSDCGGLCVNTATDLANCGACGAACAAGEVCSNGSCALSCQVGLTDCGGACANTESDIANCGACGSPCAAGEVCSAGSCALSCQATLTDCGGLCVNLMNDGANCGVCGAACAADAVCSDGSCVSTTPVALRLLTISDWHAQLDPLTISMVDYGGAAVLSTYFKNERATNPNTLTLTAGDAYGGSPPLSAFYDEIPAVKAMNLMGFTADTFGNHNFDKGMAKLQALIDIASFSYVSCNLNNLAANLTGVKEPYYLVDVGGVRVALIGVTNDDAADLLFPGALGSITVADSVTSAMAAKAAAKTAGARVFVALVHKGATGYNAGTGVYSGPLIDFASALSGFHVVVGDHTNLEVNTTINGARVVENQSKGRTYARIDLTVVPWTGALVSSNVTIVNPVASAVVPDPAVVAMLAPYKSSLSAIMDAVIGVATDIFPRNGNVERLQEVALGDLTTDAIRMKYGTQIAYINAGGLRAPLPSSYLPANTMLRRTSPGYALGPPYDLVRGDVFALLPFGNVVVTRTVTGSQLWAMLENGVSLMPAPAGRFPQISGFHFTYSLSAPAGSRVQSAALDDNTPILKDSAVYTLATVDFVNAGGDGYAMLADGMGTTRAVMADVVDEYITAQGTITPTTSGRTTQVP